VRVLDENDNSPLFDPKVYSASVSENATIGLSVLQVSATDLDEGLNGRVRYTIVGGDINFDFHIGEDSGIIRVAKNLNFERRSQYVLTIQVEDSGNDVRYDTAMATITIMDINDNAPVFLDSPYIAYVMEENNRLPVSVITVQAHDADSPPHNRVRYLIKDGDKGIFRVNGTTGEISVLRSLDRETQSRYEVVVVAMDSGKFFKKSFPYSFMTICIFLVISAFVYRPSLVRKTTFLQLISHHSFIIPDTFQKFRPNLK
jgi:protocadherin Fat 4